MPLTSISCGASCCLQGSSTGAEARVLQRRCVSLFHAEGIQFLLEMVGVLVNVVWWVDGFSVASSRLAGSEIWRNGRKVGSSRLGLLRNRKSLPRLSVTGMPRSGCIVRGAGERQRTHRGCHNRCQLPSFLTPRGATHLSKIAKADATFFRTVPHNSQPPLH